jgi:acyl-CoA reductase-like NAD-dependent aldehyde dehydrogenase
VTIQSVNPRTGESFGPQFTDMGASEVAGVIDASLSVFSQWSASQPSERKRAIYAIADAIDSANNFPIAHVCRCGGYR